MEVNEKMLGLGSKRSIIREIFEYSKKRSEEIGKDNVFDFSLGNPSVEPPKEVNETIKELCDKLHIIFEVANKYYPSSKRCSSCGNKKEVLRLSDRIFKCECCGLIIDRDYNASLNLLNLIKEKIGKVLAEFTPADLTALLSILTKCRIATSKVEPGIQQNL